MRGFLIGVALTTSVFMARGAHAASQSDFLDDCAAAFLISHALYVWCDDGRWAVLDPTDDYSVWRVHPVMRGPY